MAPNRHAAFTERVDYMKKAMLSVVTAIAALSVFSGCSSGREPSQNNDGETCPIYSGSYKIWDASLAERVFFPDYDSLTENDIQSLKATAYESTTLGWEKACIICIGSKTAENCSVTRALSFTIKM